MILFVGYHPLLLGFTPPASATASTAPGALGMRPPGFMGGRYQFNFPTTWLNIMFGCAKFLTSIIGAIEIDGSYQPFSQWKQWRFPDVISTFLVCFFMFFPICLRCLFQLSWFGRSISNFPVFSPQVLQFPGCGTLGVPPVVPPVVLPVAPLRPPNLIQQQAMGGPFFLVAQTLKNLEEVESVEIYPWKMLIQPRKSWISPWNMVISQQNVVIEWDMNVRIWMGISWEEIIWVWE